MRVAAAAGRGGRARKRARGTGQAHLLQEGARIVRGVAVRVKVRIAQARPSGRRNLPGCERVRAGTALLPLRGRGRPGGAGGACVRPPRHRVVVTDPARLAGDGTRGAVHGDSIRARAARDGRRKVPSGTLGAAHGVRRCRIARRAERTRGARGGADGGRGPACWAARAARRGEPGVRDRAVVGGSAGCARRERRLTRARRVGAGRAGRAGGDRGRADGGRVRACRAGRARGGSVARGDGGAPVARPADGAARGARVALVRRVRAAGARKAGARARRGGVCADGAHRAGGVVCARDARARGHAHVRVLAHRAQAAACGRNVGAHMGRVVPGAGRARGARQAVGAVLSHTADGAHTRAARVNLPAAAVVAGRARALRVVGLARTGRLQGLARPSVAGAAGAAGGAAAACLQDTSDGEVGPGVRRARLAPGRGGSSCVASRAVVARVAHAGRDAHAGGRHGGKIAGARASERRRVRAVGEAVEGRAVVRDTCVKGVARAR